jgi:predicted transcriptional regulator
MYYNREEAPIVGTRKLITISLPPELLKKAEHVAQQENRTKSELLREALRFYIDTNEVRRRAARERLFALIDRVQARTRSVPPREIRKLVREAVEAARRARRLASA